MAERVRVLVELGNVMYLVGTIKPAGRTLALRRLGDPRPKWFGSPSATVSRAITSAEGVRGGAGGCRGCRLSWHPCRPLDRRRHLVHREDRLLRRDLVRCPADRPRRIAVRRLKL